VKRAVVIVFLCLAGFGGLFLYVRSKSIPPQEAKFIRDFYAHRASYERLRDMLIADKQVIRIGKWGVATQSHVVPSIPPEGDFPIARYRDYMSLLKEVGGFVASRSEGEDADPSIGLWGWGFAGNTRHVGICWLHEKPIHQIDTLDGYRTRRGHPNQQIAYRHIDENWYLWTDL
jgi:hypothetical protein